MSSRNLIVPTAAEDAAIAAGIAADPDAIELSDAEIAEAAAQKRSRGRPAGSDKATISIRLDLDLLEALRATGRGWQTRANDALRREFVDTHKTPSRHR